MNITCRRRHLLCNLSLGPPRQPKLEYPAVASLLCQDRPPTASFYAFLGTTPTQNSCSARNALNGVLGDSGRMQPEGGVSWGWDIFPDNPRREIGGRDHQDDHHRDHHRRRLAVSQAAMCAQRARKMYDEAAKERQKLSEGRGKKGQDNCPDLKGQARDQVGGLAAITKRDHQAARGRGGPPLNR